MGFRAPNTPNLLPLLLQHTLNQRAAEEARRFREDQITQQRSESALDVAVRALSQGVSADEAISLAGPDFPADRIRGLKGIERARKQQQKTQDEQSRIAPAAEGLAATLGSLQTGGDPRSLTTFLGSLQGAFSPESISAITTEGPARLAANQARIRENIPITFYNPVSGEFAGQGRPGTPEFERLASNPNLTRFEPSGIPSEVFPTDKVVRRQAQLQLSQTIGEIRQTRELLKTIREADPKSFGVRPALANFVGQIMTTIDPTDPTLREQVTNAIAGGTVADRRNLYIQSAAAVAAAVSALTAEKSGRITAEERQITEDALRLAGFGSTKQDAEEAMQLVYIMHQGTSNLKSITAGMKPQYNLVSRSKSGDIVTNKAALEKLTRDGANAGLSDENIKRLVRTIRAQQVDLVEAGLGQ